MEYKIGDRVKWVWEAPILDGPSMGDWEGEGIRKPNPNDLGTVMEEDEMNAMEGATVLFDGHTNPFYCNASEIAPAAHIVLSDEAPNVYVRRGSITYLIGCWHDPEVGAITVSREGHAQVEIKDSGGGVFMFFPVPD